MGWMDYRPSLLLVGLIAAAAKDIPVSSPYVIRHTDSCPDVDYYFRREPAPNALDPGSCLLCFCRDNGTAACWPRESKRCDVEKYHLHRFRRDTRRIRRSPLSLTDIFFRDATRDFFDKNLPEECKPFEESYSDGCPPVDWCIGCTICDCDANGRWDCHILSFCNDAEKKKIDGVKIPPPKALRKGLKGKSGYRPFRTQRTPTAKKPIPKHTPKPTPKPKNKRTTKQTRKSPPAKKVIKKEIRKVIRKVTNDTKTQTTNPKERRIVIRRKANNQKIKQKRENPDQTIKDIVIKREVATHKPVALSKTLIKGTNNNNTKNEYLLGQMLVKRVMSSVQRLVQTELDSLNKTMEKMQDGDCEETQRRNRLKQYNPAEYKYKKIGQEFRWLRDKRDIDKQTTNSYYDNGRETTTDNFDFIKDTFTNNQNSSDLTNAPDLMSVSLNVSPKIIKDFSNNARIYEVASAIKSTFDNGNTTSILNEKKKSNISVEIGFKNNTTVNNTENINKTNQIKQNISNVVPEFYNVNSKKLSITQFKYQIDNNATEKLKTLTTMNITTLDNEKNTNNMHRKQKVTDSDVNKKYDLKKVINKKYKQLTSIYFPPNEFFKNVMAPKQTIFVGNKKILQKNGTQKQKRITFIKYIRKIFHKLFFVKKKKYLQQKDDEYQILRILCENGNACNINRKNRNILRMKIKKINIETVTIFRTIKIIKGLLHLIDIPNYNNTSNFKDDINKLKIILQETNRNFSYNMSDSQKMQIEYIKRNTNTFTESVARFTELLDEIILILQKTKKATQTPYYTLANKNMTKSFDKVRKLLLKHKLVENTFIKNIYNMLSDLENKTKPNETQVSDKPKNNKIIENYSRNIIENLRKLKGLAQALNSNRSKREVTTKLNDNTIEYLLLLMEYLIRKDHPDAVEPANDGIDLLIDTIKSAPDIKSIKKKVLENLSTSENGISASSDDIGSKSNDSISESSSMSKETNVSTIINTDNVFKNNDTPQEDDILQASHEELNITNSTDHDFNDNVLVTYVHEKEVKEERKGFEKFENLNAVDIKRYETSIENNELYPRGVHNSANNETTPVVESYYEFQDTTTVKTNDRRSDEGTGNLEWIEENFGNEIREIRHSLEVINKSETITSTAATTTSTETSKNIVEINMSNTSQEDNKIEKKLSTEEVMYRKQMDLLNSLDYGTPRSDFEDTRSIDDEKFTVDTYF